MQQKLLSTVESTAKLDKDAANIQNGLNTRAYRVASKASGLQQKLTFGSSEEGPLQCAQRQLKQEIKQLSRTLDGQVKEIMAPVAQKYSDDMIQLFKKRAGNISQSLQNNRLYYNQDPSNTTSTRQPDPLLKQVELEESIQDYKNKLQQALVNVSMLQSKCEKQQEVVDNLNSLIKDVHSQNQEKTKRLEEFEKKSIEQQEQIDKLQLIASQQKATIDAQAKELQTLEKTNAELSKQLNDNNSEIQTVTDKMSAVQAKYKEKKQEIKQYQTLNFQLQQQISQLSYKILNLPQFVGRQQCTNTVQPQASDMNSNEPYVQVNDQFHEPMNAEAQESSVENVVDENQNQEIAIGKLHLYKQASQHFYESRNKTPSQDHKVQDQQEQELYKIEQKDEEMQTLNETNEVMLQTSVASESATMVDQQVGSSNDILQCEDVAVITDVAQNQSFGVQVEAEYPVQQDGKNEEQQQNNVEIEENTIEIEHKSHQEDNQIFEENQEEINTVGDEVNQEQQQQDKEAEQAVINQQEVAIE